MTQPNFKYDCGDQIKHLITGFVGIIVSRTQWFNGCLRYAAQGAKLKDGQPTDCVAFDQEELTLVKRQVHASVTAVEPVAPKPPGGPKRGERATLTRRW